MLDRREVVAVDVPAPTDVVWQALRDPREIRRWYGWERDGLDAEIRRVFTEEPTVAEVGAGTEPGGTTRSLSWRHGNRLTVAPVGTDGQHTRVTLTRPAEADVWFEGMYDEADEAWTGSLQQLRFALSQHPGEDRTTFTALGMDAGPHDRRLVDRAGLGTVRGAHLGGYVEARRPDGSLLGGVVWHRTAHQVGVVLHGLVRALLVVTEVPAGHHPPHGVVSAVLSVYGSDEATLAETGRRWRAWWSLPG